MINIEASLADARLRSVNSDRPVITLSYAQSLDGCLAIERGRRTSLSSPQAMQMTHRLRAAHQAILVGIGTVLAAAVWALGCESEVVARPVLYVPVPEPCVAVPSQPDDGLLAMIQQVDGYESAYHSERPPSIVLGYIGDAPIGRYPTVQHRLQEWEKPFRLGGSYGAGLRHHGVP